MSIFLNLSNSYFEFSCNAPLDYHSVTSPGRPELPSHWNGDGGRLLADFLFPRPVPGSGDESAGGGGELRDQAGAGCGEAAVQLGQREPGESTRHHQGAAAAEGEERPGRTCILTGQKKPFPSSLRPGNKPQITDVIV